VPVLMSASVRVVSIAMDASLTASPNKMANAKVMTWLSTELLLSAGMELRNSDADSSSGVKIPAAMDDDEEEDVEEEEAEEEEEEAEEEEDA
jgi:hypothetical protein